MTGNHPAALLRRLNPYCARALDAAASLCQTRAHAEITIEHWLLKLLEQGEGDITVIARRYEWDIDTLWQSLLAHLDTLPRPVRERPQLSEPLAALIRQAWLIASLEGDDPQIRSQHLLMALTEKPMLPACNDLWVLLSLSRVQLERLRPLLDAQSDECPARQPQVTEPLTSALPETATADAPAKTLTEKQDDALLAVLNRFTEDVTEKARSGRIDPVFGRDTEIRQMVDILSRRRKNNPILVGEPGVGKSTMLLQLCGAISNQHSVLYITGEESVRQVKLRAARLKVPQENIYLAAENDVDEICGLIEKEKPELVVIDSIQTMRCMDLSSSAGTVSQVKESAARLLAVAKKQEIPMFIVGHVNKDGAIAGPKVMEHIVDTVLYFEGDKMLPYRILRAAKNRYGSTNELGMFDMTGQGLEEIENPSKMLLEGRPLGVSGNCVACTMEGSRPILSEIQALATKTNFPAPRRACSGYDYNRMNLLIAVLEKRAGYFFGNLDVYINIVGGIALRDTACDLAVCLCMVSSLLDCPVSDKLIAIGEVGLGGEVRSVPNLEQRLREAERIGFERAVVPKHSLAHLNPEDYPGMKLIGAAYISDAIHALKSDRL